MQQSERVCAGPGRALSADQRQMSNAVNLHKVLHKVLQHPIEGHPQSKWKGVMERTLSIV